MCLMPHALLERLDTVIRLYGTTLPPPDVQTELARLAVTIYNTKAGKEVLAELDSRVGLANDAVIAEIAKILADAP